MDFSRQSSISTAARRIPELIRLVTPDQDDETLFESFVEDISLSPEELELFVAMPETSIADVRKLVAALHSRC